MFNKTEKMCRIMRVVSSAAKKKKLRTVFLNCFPFFLLLLPLNCELVCVFDWNFGRGVG